MYQVAVRAAELAWTPLDFVGVFIKTLHRDEATGATTVMTKMEAGAIIPKHHHGVADETVYILEGDFEEDGRPFEVGSFFVGKAGTTHGPHASHRGCFLLTTFSAEVDFLLD